MEGFRKKIKIFLIYAEIILVGFVLFSKITSAATLFLAPSSGTYSVGESFGVVVKVNTEGAIINAGEGTIIFNPNELTVTQLSKSTSIFNMWVQEPNFSNALGTINFGGIIFNPGYTGASATILTIYFKAKATSNTLLLFSSGAILANDGLGTNILSAMSGGTYFLKPNSATPQTAPGAQAPFAPVIKSPTHPDQLKWYSNNNPEFSWVFPEGVDNISYILDQEPGSDPDSISDGLKNSLKFTNVNDGIYYFHIKFRKSGEWGLTTHYKLRIDTIPPPIIEITQDQVIIIFKGIDNLSGVDFYQMKIGDGSWFRIDKSLEGQPYKLPMVQFLGFHNISVKATDFAGNSIITEFDIDIIEKIFVTVPVKQGEQLELRGKAKPNSRLIISISIAEAAKQMPGAQISSLTEESGNYTKQIEKTADGNGDWQIKLSDLPPIKYILAISLQDYSIFFSKNSTVASAGWFQIKNLSQGILFAGIIVALVGLLIFLYKLFGVGIKKLWYKIRRQQEIVITKNEKENGSLKKL